MSLKNTHTRLTGEPMKIGLSPSILGRTFNGLGQPIDGLGAIVNSSRGIIAAYRQEKYSEFPYKTFETSLENAYKHFSTQISKTEKIGDLSPVFETDYFTSAPNIL